MEKIETDCVSREVIDGKLLAVLDDQDKVAVVLNEVELQLLINVIGISDPKWFTSEDSKILVDLHDGMMQLKQEAFDAA